MNTQNLLNFLKKHAVAIFICTSIYLFWINLLWMKYSNYGYYDWDLALYANTMAALCKGSIESSLFGTSFLTNHTQYIAFLLTPIYAIFFHPFTLIFLKVSFFFGGVFVIYLIAEQKLSTKLAIFLMLLFTLYPPNIFMLFYEFHFENLAILFIALMFYFIDKQNLKGFVISALLGALVKENICLVVIFMGVYAYFKSNRKMAWGLAPIIIGASIFCVSVFLVMPAMRGYYNLSTSNQYLTLYAHHLDPQSSGIVSNVISNIFTQANLKYVSALFSPFNIVPVLSPFTLFPAIPLFLQHLLSSAPAMKLPIYHYMASLSVFLLYSSIHALFWIKKMSRNVYKFLLIILLLCFTGALYQASPLIRIRIKHFGDHVAIKEFDLHKRVPMNQPVTATFEFLTPLANHTNITSFHQVWENHNVFSNTDVDVGNIEYALINLENSWLWAELYLKEASSKHKLNKNLYDFYFKHNWKTLFLANGYALLKKSKIPEDSFITITKKPALDPDTIKLDIVLANSLRLNGLKLDHKMTIDGRKLVNFKMLWKCIKPYESPVEIIFSVKEKSGGLVFEKTHQPGYLIYPNDVWQEGEHVEDVYNLSIPALPKGEYQLFMRFIDFNRNPIKFLKSGKPDDIDVIEVFEFKTGKRS